MTSSDWEFQVKDQTILNMYIITSTWLLYTLSYNFNDQLSPFMNTQFRFFVHQRQQDKISTEHIANNADISDIKVDRVQKTESK